MKRVRVAMIGQAGLGVLALVALAVLLAYHLGSLVGGISSGELQVATMPVGWHGIYHHPQNLPLKLVRSVDFAVFRHHGQTLTRLPNVLFGAAGIASFAWLVSLWHSRRTAALATLLFATGAWTLHVSRVASNDVLYLWAIPTLLLSYSLLHHYPRSKAAWYGALLAWLLLLYVPGMVWLLVISAYTERKVVAKAWRYHQLWREIPLSLLLLALSLPLLVLDVLRHGRLVQWLGAPAAWPSVATVVRHELAVPYHLLVRGPAYPELWLARAPVLDIFTLVIALLGIIFYARHWQASRTRLLAGLFIGGGVLVGLGGPVSFSLLIPLVYVTAATGLAYLIHEWLRTFPRNPLARGVGFGVIGLAIGLSCLYNLRAYFVAWPHNATTQATFRYRLER